MRRFGSVARVKADKLELFKEAHAIGWPEVLVALRRSHLGNYSIFLHGDLLFTYFEYTGDDPGADREEFLADPAMQRWRRLNEACTEPIEPGGRRWTVMEEVFHTD